MSKKVKYYYDADSLTYHKVNLRARRKVGFVALFIVASALFGALSFLVVLNSTFFETPKDKLLTREINNLSLNYKVLNKKLDQIDNVLGNIEDRDNNLYRAYFNATPISEEKRKELILGKNRYKEINGFNNADLVTNTMKRVDVISKQLSVQSKSLDEILKLAEAKNDLLEAIPAIQPVKNEDLKRMASGFGYRSDPFTKAKKFHKGMDFTSRIGTPIYATGNGVVTNTDNSLSGYGNHVEIQHGFGYKTLYAHMSRYNCKPGQKVKRGDVIGFVGSTGRSQGPHLHYEVYKDGEVVNPLNFYYGNISAAEYTVISKIANQENQSLD